MLQKFLHRFLKPRHYWRDIGFDELSELYTSMLFRSVGMNLIGIFIPLYLYKQGTEISEIFIFYAMCFIFMAIFAPWVALTVARIGPKHTMAISYIFQIIALAMLTTLPVMQWPLWIIAVWYGAGSILFYLSFHVDFSKVKHRDHGGKELGWLIIVERAGAIAGPAIGGLVAYFFGAQYAFLAAMILFAIGVVPLFLTAEPIKVHQKLDLNKVRLKELKHTLLSGGAFNIDNSVALIIWPMFAGIIIFQNNPYIQLGAITSVGVIISVLSAKAIGSLIDKDKGRTLLRIGSVLNAIIHLFRPAVSGFTPAVAINMSSEIAASSSHMPYLKGMYDEADEKEGARILYFTILEVFTTLTRSVFFCLAAVIATFQTDKGIFIPLFIMGAFASLLIMTERFRALYPR